MDSRVGTLYTAVIDFVEKLADHKTGTRDERRRTAPVVSYGFDKSDMTRVYDRFDASFGELSREEGIELAGLLIRSGNGTLIHIGIHLLGLWRDELGPAHFMAFDEFLDHFRGWGHVDHFGTGNRVVVQPLLDKHQDAVIGLLRKWNRSENRWKRRASVVVFTRRVAESGRFIDETLELCENLIRDTEDLVRKGVGWALKDTMRADKDRVLAYVRSLRRRGVSSVITLHAIRDLKGAERADVLRIHKPRRRSRQ